MAASGGHSFDDSLDMDARELRHGYGYDEESRPLDAAEGSLAYHLRRHRRQYGQSGISQRELATLARVSRHFVEDLERSPQLKGRVEPLVRVAIALGQPVESLIAPERYRALSEDVERRRSTLGGTAELPDARPPVETARYHLAVAYRSPYLLMALSDGKTVLDLRQHRASVGERVRIRRLIEREVRAYGVKEIIVETGSKIAEDVVSLGIPARTITLPRAKQAIVGDPGRAPPTNRAFFPTLLAARPELGRYVTTLPTTGRLAMSERWRVSRLVVATLALAATAAAAAGPPVPPPDGQRSPPRTAPRPRAPGSNA